MSLRQGITKPAGDPRPLVDPAPSGNQTHETSWSVLGPPYHRLLRSAGATEGLFITRELHITPGYPLKLYFQIPCVFPVQQQIFPVQIYIICDYYIHKTDLADLSSFWKKIGNVHGKYCIILYLYNQGIYNLSRQNFLCFPCVLAKFPNSLCFP